MDKVIEILAEVIALGIVQYFSATKLIKELRREVSRGFQRCNRRIDMHDRRANFNTRLIVRLPDVTNADPA